MNLKESMTQGMVGRYADELIDSGVPKYEDQVRFPDVATYDPLARLAWLDERDEQYREDNELHHDIMNHAQDCKQTHTYLAGDKMKPACTECMLMINKLYGVRPYHVVKKEAA